MRADIRRLRRGGESELETICQCCHWMNRVSWNTPKLLVSTPT